MKILTDPTILLHLKFLKLESISRYVFGTESIFTAEWKIYIHRCSSEDNHL